MASAANQIPLIDGFIAWGLRRDQLVPMVDASTQTDSPGPVVYRDPTTTAQRLSEMPASNVSYQQLGPNHDSGYGSMGHQDHLDDDKTPQTDGEPQQPCTQYAEDKEDYFPEITQFNIDNCDFSAEGGSLNAILEDANDFDISEFVNLP